MRMKITKRTDRKIVLEKLEEDRTYAVLFLLPFIRLYVP